MDLEKRLNNEQGSMENNNTFPYHGRISALWAAFYSRALYRDVAQRWKGVGFLYLLLLLAVAWIPVLYVADRSMDLFMNNDGDRIIAQLPHVTVQGGEISMNQPAPYVIHDAKGQAVVIFDPKLSLAEALVLPGQMFVLKDQVVIKGGPGSPHVIPVPLQVSWSGGPGEVSTLVHRVHHSIAMFIFPTAMIISLIYRLIQAVFYVAIGSLIFCKMAKVNLNYAAMMRISLVAITPAVLLSSIFNIFNINFAGEYLAYFLLSMGYLAFGVWANQSEVKVKQDGSD